MYTALRNLFNYYQRFDNSDDTSVGGLARSKLAQMALTSGSGAAVVRLYQCPHAGAFTVSFNHAAMCKRNLTYIGLGKQRFVDPTRWFAAQQHPSGSDFWVKKAAYWSDQPKPASILEATHTYLKACIVTAALHGVLGQPVDVVQAC